MTENNGNKPLNMALEASAGTGKTYQLSMRVAGMLISGVPPRDILCLTFTNKAADEMLERIIGTLTSVAEGKAEPEKIETLSELIKKYKKTDDKYTAKNIRIDAEKSRDRLLEEFSSLRVKTIDSFFNGILKLFPFEAQIRQDYVVKSEEQFAEFMEEAFYSVMEELLKDKEWNEIFSLYTEVAEQNPSASVEKLGKYALFACERRIELGLPIGKGKLSPGDLLEAIKKCGDEKSAAIEKIRKFANLLETQKLNANQQKTYEKLLKIGKIKDAVGEKILSGHPAEHGYFKKYHFIAEQLAIHEEIAGHIRGYLSLKGQIAKAFALGLGGALYGELKKIKTEKNMLTHSDIEEKVFDILVEEKNIDRDYLYFRLDSKINHILIDEFQDTSVPQWLILRPLAEEAMAGLGQYDKSGSFFYVGDPKQNLYRFRGGSSSLFGKVAEAYADKLFRRTLDKNYRSDKNIVEAVNEIFNKISTFLDNSASKNFQIDQKTTKDRENGYFSAEIPEENGEKAEKFTEFCLKKVREALAAGFSLSEIAVLIPSNKDGLEIKNVLMQSDIPVRLETSGKLSDTGVFKAAAALAEFIETEDPFAFLEYAMTAVPAFSTKSYASSEKREKIKNAILKAAREAGAPTIFGRFLAAAKETDIQRRFEKEPDFIQAMDVFACNASDETMAGEFKDTVFKAASDRISLTSRENEAVTVMTVHKAKGLQFPCVILPKLDFALETDAKNSSFILTENISGKSSFEFVHTKKSAPFLDEKQAAVIAAENSLVAQDAMNALYVAFTRAEKALMAAVEIPKKTGDKPTDTGTLLASAIELPYIKGSLGFRPVKKTEKIRKNSISVPDKCRTLEPKKNIRRETAGDYKSVAFGTAFHAGAFLLDGFSPQDAEAAFFQAMASYGAFLDGAEKEEIKNYLNTLASTKEWQELFQGRVFRERKTGIGGSLNSIDFYSILKNHVVIIEYKTGEIDEATKVKYAAQLDYYELILKKTYGLPIKKYVYYFHNGKLEIIGY